MIKEIKQSGWSSFFTLGYPPEKEGDGAMVTNDYIFDAIIVIFIAIVLKMLLDRRKKITTLSWPDNGYFLSNYFRSTAYADFLNLFLI